MVSAGCCCTKQGSSHFAIIPIVLSSVSQIPDFFFFFNFEADDQLTNLLDITTVHKKIDNLVSYLKICFWENVPSSQ